MGQTSDTKVEGERSSRCRYVEKPLLYIAGPMLSSGNAYTNIADAIWAGEDARYMGWAVLVPHLDCLTAMVTNKGDGNYYLDNDFNLLSRCDAVCMLPHGNNPDCGAAQELDLAESLGIPIYTRNTLPTAEEFRLREELEEPEHCPHCGLNIDNVDYNR